MPYHIQNQERGLVLELKGGVTARDATELSRSLTASLKAEGTVVVQTAELEDIDTSILQMLISLRKTVASFLAPDPSDAFVSAVDRCAIRRELLGESKEAP